MFTYLKGATLLFSKLIANRYAIGLLNELLGIVIVQGAVKVCHVKVGGKKDSNRG